VVLDRPVPGDVHELLRGELQHEGHDADVGIERLHRGRGLGRLERGELEDLQALLLGGDPHGVRLAAGLLGGDEDARDGIAAGEEGFEDGLAEILLADEGDFHLFSPKGEEPQMNTDEHG
jgi:hypothetical protein